MGQEPIAEKTPEGRLTEKFLEIIDKLRANFYRTGHGPEFPDRADIREGMKLHIQREILEAQIEISSLPYSESQTFVLRHKLSKVNWEIKKRESE